MKYRNILYNRVSHKSISYSCNYRIRTQVTLFKNVHRFDRRTFHYNINTRKIYYSMQSRQQKLYLSRAHSNTIQLIPFSFFLFFQTIARSMTTSAFEYLQRILFLFISFFFPFPDSGSQSSAETRGRNFVVPPRLISNEIISFF